MSRREKEIRIMVSETEYKTISENAKKNKMQVAPYLRMVGQNPIVNQIEYKPIREHTAEISKLRESINRLIFSIEASNNYLPKEIETIVEMIAAIFKSENKLLEGLRNERIKTYQRTYRKNKKE